MRHLCLIPARGGSKRLPRKNVIDFRGRPMIAYTITAALETELFDRVVVSTDDADIAKAANSVGAEVEDRVAELASDTASVMSVTLDFLRQEELAGRTYDTLTVLYATSPLRTSKDIKATHSLLGAECDFAMAVTNFDLPVHQALLRNEEGALRAALPDMVSLQSQDAPTFLVDNGSTYCVRVSALHKHRTWYGPGLRGYVMERPRSVDINLPEDLGLALFWAERLSAE
jgi:pseudaminic acid cytidylyltransferase